MNRRTQLWGEKKPKIQEFKKKLSQNYKAAGGVFLWLGVASVFESVRDSGILCVLKILCC